MTDPATAREVVAKLTKAQREVLLESEPGAWRRNDCGTGSELHGSARWAAARALERKALGDVEEHPRYYPSGLYFNNLLGLACREILMEGKDG